MVRKSQVKIMTTPNYVKKSVTVRPDKDNEVFTFQQIKKYCDEKLKSLPKGTKYVVRAENILRDTTLKGLDDDFMQEEDYDEYTKGKVKDNTKFKYFKNFTITMREPNNDTKSMFAK